MQNQQKILLVQLFSNGDCLYATAVARQIKNDFPGCHLTWAVAGFCKSIIANNPFVDAVLEVNTIAKSDEASFRKFQQEIYERKTDGTFDEIFTTHLSGANQANYDGSIRSAIFRGYPKSLPANIQPVLRLTESEINRVELFAKQHHLDAYVQVVLFEFAPMSGQSKMTKELATEIAEQLTENKKVAIILSSGNKISHLIEGIIDGSSLTLRETAGLTHFCTLLLGCSSGITWVSTSDAAKCLPMIQLLNPSTTWVNPISRDFERFGLDTDGVIEIISGDKYKIVQCVQQAMENFAAAKKEFNQQIPLHFKTTRNIVYNLLCYLEFGAIAKHIRINHKIYGADFSFYSEIFLGIITAPFKLARNIFTKNLKQAKR